MGGGALVPCRAMAGRPVFSADLGRFFQELRTAKGWSQRQAESIAARRGLGTLTKNILWRLEAGKVKNPEPDTLRAVASLYGMSYELLVAQFMQARYGVTGDDSRPEAASQIVRLESDRARLREQIKELRGLAEQALSILDAETAALSPDPDDLHGLSEVVEEAATIAASRHTTPRTARTDARPVRANTKAGRERSR